MVEPASLVEPHYRRALIIGSSEYRGELPPRLKGQQSFPRAEKDAALMKTILDKKFGIPKIKSLTGAVSSQDIEAELEDIYREALRSSHE